MYSKRQIDAKYRYKKLAAILENNMKWLTKLKQKTKLNALRRETRMELSRMSNRDLNDIGLTRSDIERVARAATLPNLK